MPVRFYNTLTRELENFVPQNPGEVSLYTCGPTVYNYAHIGNLRTFLFEDLMKRWLEYRGMKVNHVRNLTDVDDKTIRDSQAKGLKLSEFTDIYKKAFFEDLKTLHIEPAGRYPAATDHIPEMEDMISKLVGKGYAYETDDGVYFKVSSFEGYGRLAHLEHSTLQEGASGRVTKDEYDRESVTDFALWKKWSPGDGDVKWHTRFGEGRPGWHIECSVMSMKYLGETLDIHSGGVDLVFPHHTNEAAQSEALTGKPFVRYWMHATHLMVDGEKMSKSKGNFYTLRDLLAKGFAPRTIRYALITTHYRKPLNFTFDGLKAAEGALARLDDFILSMKNTKREGGIDPAAAEILAVQESKFEAALDEDLNISEAMGALFELVKAFNERSGEITATEAREVLEFLGKADKALGFLNTNCGGELTVEHQKLLDLRAEARLAKDWKRSDELRDELAKLGVEVRDSAGGQVWKKI